MKYALAPPQLHPGSFRCVRPKAHRRTLGPAVAANREISEIPCVTVVSVVTTEAFLSVRIRKVWGMGTSSREEIVEVFRALDDDAERLCALSFDVFTPLRIGYGPWSAWSAWRAGCAHPGTR